MKKPELLLPVGSMKMALAAIHNGADAIYLGMPGFNARGRTHDHDHDELKEIIEICHLYNVQVHIAFNILIFQDELVKASQALKEILELSPDALIVQDIGLISLIKQMAPEQVIHGSTQMTVTNHEAIDLLSDLDIKRFVLGRENSLSEIEKIKKSTNKELEVFVHGALCVAYSGQCFTSEALGGRSANRGQCAQSCRYEYELYIDEKKHKLVEQKFLLSPQDLCGIDQVPELIKIGVDSFKVEGRLKGPEYVSSVASHYRTMIDKRYKNVNATEEMELTFSRGFYPGWLKGVAHQELVTADFSGKRGTKIGDITKINRTSIEITNLTSLLIEPGDGVLFANTNSEIGGNVYRVKATEQGFKLEFAKDFKYQDLRMSQNVYLSSKKGLYKELNKSYSHRDNLKRIPISVKISGKLNTPLTLLANEGTSKIEISTETALEAAKSNMLTHDSIKLSISGLSHSPYQISDFQCELDTNLFLHNRELKILKQKMVMELNKARLIKNTLSLKEISLPKKIDQTPSTRAKLSILLRTIEQVNSTCSFLDENLNIKESISKIIIDFEFGKDFSEAVELIKQSNIESVIATTRILKPNEYHNFKQIMRANPDSILIRNLGALEYFKFSELNLYGDFSLNMTNSKTFEYLIGKGLNTICASYDLNAKRLYNLLDYTDTSKIEITLHQYMPEFHMEHCVFAAYLSEGNSFKDCGKPCEKHRVRLKDMYGNMHEIKADQECRNTMFRSIAQSAAPLLPECQKRGVENFRYEALHEEKNELISKISIYIELINGNKSPKSSLEELEKLEAYGINTGQLYKNKDYIDRKQ